MFEDDLEDDDIGFDIDAAPVKKPSGVKSSCEIKFVNYGNNAGNSVGIDFLLV